MKVNRFHTLTKGNCLRKVELKIAQSGQCYRLNTKQAWVSCSKKELQGIKEGRKRYEAFMKKGKGRSKAKSKAKGRGKAKIGRKGSLKKAKSRLLRLKQAILAANRKAKQKHIKVSAAAVRKVAESIPAAIADKPGVPAAVKQVVKKKVVRRIIPTTVLTASKKPTAAAFKQAVNKAVKHDPEHAIQRIAEMYGSTDDVPAPIEVKKHLRTLPEFKGVSAARLMEVTHRVVQKSRDLRKKLRAKKTRARYQAWVEAIRRDNPDMSEAEVKKGAAELVEIMAGKMFT